MKIGLLSDTHDFLDTRIFEYFKDCDEIWHAGDFGGLALVKQLDRFKPLRGVYGNIDDKDVIQRFEENLRFECEGLQILMTHIGGSPPHYNPRVKKLFADEAPDIFICGHSHILKVVRDSKLNILYLNPGAAGNQGFHHIKTMIRFEITRREIKNLEVIELGKRGALN